MKKYRWKMGHFFFLMCFVVLSGCVEETMTASLPETSSAPEPVMPLFTRYTTSEGIETAAVLSARYNRFVLQFDTNGTEVEYNVDPSFRNSVMSSDEIEILYEVYDTLMYKLSESGIALQTRLSMRSRDALLEKAAVLGSDLVVPVNRFNVSVPFDSPEELVFNLWGDKVQNSAQVHFAKEACTLLDVDAVITIDMGFGVVAGPEGNGVRLPYNSKLALYTRVSAINRQGEHVINDLFIASIPEKHLSNRVVRALRRGVIYNDDTAVYVEGVFEQYLDMIYEHSLENKFFPKVPGAIPQQASTLTVISSTK